MFSSRKKELTPQEQTARLEAARQESMKQAAQSRELFELFMAHPRTSEADRADVAVRFLCNLRDVGEDEVHPLPDTIYFPLRIDFGHVKQQIERCLKLPDILRGVRQNLLLYQVYAGKERKNTRRLCIWRIIAAMDAWSIRDEATANIAIAFLRLSENLPVDECYAFCKRLAAFRDFLGLSREEKAHWRDRILATLGGFDYAEQARRLMLADEIEREVLSMK